MPPPFGAVTAYRAIVVAAFVATWNGLTVRGFQLVDLCLVLAVLAGFVSLTSPRIHAPRWIVYPAAAVVVVIVGHVILPTSWNYMAGRFALVPPNPPFPTAVKWLIALLALPWITANIIASARKAVAPVVWAWTTGAAFSGLVSVTDYLKISNVGATLLDYENIAGRQSGLASHVNNLGFACAIAVPCGIYLTARHRVIGSITLGLLAAGALLSGSRGAQAGYVVAAIITFVAVGHARRILPTIFIVGVMGTLAYQFSAPAMLAPGQLSDFMRFDDADLGVRASDTGRANLAAQALQDFGHNPIIGIGLDVLVQAHNIYLQLLAAGGLILTLPMLYFWSSAIRTGRRLQKAGVVLGGYLTATVVSWLTVGLAENQLTDRYLYFPIAFLVILAAGRSGAVPQRRTGGFVAP